MKKRYRKVNIITVCFGVILFFIFSFCSQAADISKINISDLKIATDFYSGGDTVRGSFSVENEFEERDSLDYWIFLIRDGKIFDKKIFQLNEKVELGESMDQKFEYDLPVNIKSGKYILKIQLYLKNEAALNWEEKEISVEGNDFFINVTNSYILKEGERMDAKGIQEYYPEDPPQIEVDVYNPNEIDLVLVPMIIVQCIDCPETEPKRLLESEITLISKKNDKYSADMPKFDLLGTYVAELEFLYEGENISSIENFTWKIVRRDVKILNIKTEGGLYYPGKQNKLLIEIGEYLDEGETKNVQLAVEIKDRSFNVLETFEREIGLGSGNVQEEFDSSVATEDNPLIVSASIKANGKIIDTYDGKLEAKITRKADEKVEGGAAGMIVAIFVLSMLAVFFVWRNFDKIFALIINNLNNW